MKKYKFYYENLVSGESFIVDSMVQLEKLSGMNYRGLQRRFKGGDIYYDSGGKFKIRRSEWLRDGRVNNFNPNMKN